MQSCIHNTATRTLAQKDTSLHAAGLAAGFDKDGEAPKGLLGLGFGFMEVGQLHLHQQQAPAAENVMQKAVSGLFALCCMAPVMLSEAVLVAAHLGGSGVSLVLCTQQSRAWSAVGKVCRGWRSRATLCNSSCCGIQSQFSQGLHSSCFKPEGTSAAASQHSLST